MEDKRDDNWKEKKWRYIFILFVFVFFYFLNRAFPAERIDSSQCSQAGCDFSLENPEDLDFLDPVLGQETNDHDFAQLGEPDLFLGQIFKAESEHVSEVEFDFDVIKQHNNGGKEYAVALKEVDDKKGSYEIESGALAEVEFQIKDLAKFRQKNGKYRFRLDSEVKKGKYYFVGIDNSKMQVDRFNRLILKGSDEDAFEQGSVAIRKDRKTQLLDGDLYFQIFD